MWYFAEPENISDIVNKSKEMSFIKKNDLRQMGLNGYNYAVENFDRLKLSNKYIQKINEVINEKTFLNKEIIGYSGHSYGCIEVAIKNGFSIVGYHDIKEDISNPYNLKYLGHEEELNKNTDHLYHWEIITFEKKFIKNLNSK